jgi:hypothetical protein
MIQNEPRMASARECECECECVPCASASNACQHVELSPSKCGGQLQIIDAYDGERGEQGDAVMCTVDCLADDALHLTGGQCEADLHSIKLAVVYQAVY